MMKKLAFTLACAVAFVTSAPFPASGNLDAAPAVAMRVALASTTSMTLPAAADVSVVSSRITELTPLAMRQVRGAGPWLWFKITVQKFSMWVWDTHSCIWNLAQAVFRSASTSGTTGVSPQQGSTRTDYLSENQEVNEYYQDGVLVNSDVSTSGEQLDYTEYTPDAT